MIVQLGLEVVEIVARLDGLKRMLLVLVLLLEDRAGPNHGVRYSEPEA